MENGALERDQQLDRLRKISLFAAIKDDAHYMGHLLEICSRRTFRAAEEILREGDLGAAMYILTKGEVAVHKRTRAGDSYTVVHLAASDNVFFGELALIDDERRSATVIAQTDSECLEISKASFLALGDEHPQVGLPVTREIARILSGRLRKTTEDMLTIFDALVNQLQGE